jgi:hypothetical protein
LVLSQTLLLRKEELPWLKSRKLNYFFTNHYLCTIVVDSEL